VIFKPVSAIIYRTKRVTKIRRTCTK